MKAQTHLAESVPVYLADVLWLVGAPRLACYTGHHIRALLLRLGGRRNLRGRSHTIRHRAISMALAHLLCPARIKPSSRSCRSPECCHLELCYLSFSLFFFVPSFFHLFIATSFRIRSSSCFLFCSSRKVINLSSSACFFSTNPARTPCSLSMALV